MLSGQMPILILKEGTQREQGQKILHKLHPLIYCAQVLRAGYFGSTIIHEPGGRLCHRNIR